MKEIRNAAKIPVIIGAIFILLQNLLSYIKVNNILVSVFLNAGGILILLYSGYSSVRKHDLSLLKAAVVGAIVGSVGAMVQFVITLPQMLEAVEKSGLLLTLFGVGISFPLVLFMYASVGVIFGLIGGFIAQKTKK